MTVMKEREPLNFATTSRAPPVGRPSATFRGGDFSTGGMGNFQAALTQLQQSLARRALSQVQPKRRIGHEEFDSPFSLKSVRDGSDVRCGIWPWQKLEETITHLAGLAWSPVGRTATRTGSARPTRLPAGSGLPSGTVFQVQVTIYPRKSRNI